MRKERILAVIMSVLLALSMISATVFAAEIPALDGKLKIQGTAAEGRTLSAEFKEVKARGSDGGGCCLSLGEKNS